jgi:hypothetical protein
MGGSHLFTTAMNTITLANDIADRFFINITADNFGLDRSFTATLRALLHKRLPAGESVNVALVPLRNYITTADVITEEIRRYNKDHNYTIYIVYPQDKNVGAQVLESVRS